VYVYRDAGGQPGEQDAAYWYDLPGTGSAEDAPHAAQEARGPFEPLVSSAGESQPGGAEAAAAEAAAPGSAPGQAGGEPDEDAHAHAHKLEQIKDFYLTAEAIGEANVDKHFDQLLTQQRELISEYFRQSGAGKPADDAAGPRGHEPGGRDQESGERGRGRGARGQAGRAPGAHARREDPGRTGGPASAPEGARVTADQPRAW
jgi:hypothetical protein